MFEDRNAASALPGLNRAHQPRSAAAENQNIEYVGRGNQEYCSKADDVVYSLGCHRIAILRDFDFDKPIARPRRRVGIWPSKYRNGVKHFNHI
jgi:hypothetical protein